MQAVAQASDSQRPPPFGADESPRARFKPTKLRAKFYYTMEECSRILGWTVRRTRRHLVKSGAAVKRHGVWLTTRSLLRRALPEESAELIALLDAERERN